MITAAMRSSRRSDRSRNLLTTPQGQDTRSESRGRRRPRLFTSTHPDTFHQRVKCWEKVRSESPFLKKRRRLRYTSDAQADMLSAEASSAICVQRFDDSHTSCNSHYVSHFATFFIVARAKISVVEGCNLLRVQSVRKGHHS